MSKRRTHSPEFKARVAMEAISGRKTIQEIAADHAINCIKEGWRDGQTPIFLAGGGNESEDFLFEPYHPQSTKGKWPYHIKHY